MTTYLVTYDLSKPGQNYSKLYDHLKSYGTYAHVQDSVWVIVTARTATEVRDAAKPFIDANDKLFVVQSGGVGAWTSTMSSFTDWLMKHL